MHQRPKFKNVDLTMAALFAALMAVGANLGSFLIIGGVPITFQTFIATLAGALLGSRVGPLAMIVYTSLGLMGVPVFAKFGSGFAYVLSPTFGFVISFIFIAYVIGKMIERKTNPGFRTFMFASFTGLFINYIFGTNWMYFAYKFWAQAPEQFTYWIVWLWMLVPLVKDILFSVLAAVISSRIYRTIHLFLSHHQKTEETRL